MLVLYRYLTVFLRHTWKMEYFKLSLLKHKYPKWYFIHKEKQIQHA